MKVFKNDKYKLNKKQYEALEMILNDEHTKEEIASQIGVSRKTLYNWERHNEEFRKALEWYRREMYKDFAPEALKKVVDVMRNGDTSTAQLNAAEKIMRLAGDDIEKVDISGGSEWNLNITVTDKVSSNE